VRTWENGSEDLVTGRNDTRLDVLIWAGEVQLEEHDDRKSKRGIGICEGRGGAFSDYKSINVQIPAIMCTTLRLLPTKTTNVQQHSQY
jgi:hypothetical protein